MFFVQEVSIIFFIVFRVLGEDFFLKISDAMVAAALNQGSRALTSLLVTPVLQLGRGSVFSFNAYRYLVLGGTDVVRLVL
jgi:hypothetical protein